MSVIYITCVGTEMGHPSGRLARKYGELGADVLTLFENARSLRAIFGDAVALWRYTGARRYRSALVNVNGPVVQLVALLVLKVRGIPMSIWIMDSYPGCLRYVSRVWWVFWPFFYIASWLVKTLAEATFVIDESFIGHAPKSQSSISRTHYIPLPIPEAPFCQIRQSDRMLTLGVLGNIEQYWIDKKLPSLLEVATDRGFRVLLATSQKVSLPEMASDNIAVVMPWPKEETEKIFRACDYLLVPLTPARLIYSSPSKIVEAYSRGLQPVIDTDYFTWKKNKDRTVYQRCLHLQDFLEGRLAYGAGELHAFASHWTGQWEFAIKRSLDPSNNGIWAPESSNTRIKGDE